MVPLVLLLVFESYKTTLIFRKHWKGEHVNRHGVIAKLKI